MLSVIPLTISLKMIFVFHKVKKALEYSSFIRVGIHIFEEIFCETKQAILNERISSPYTFFLYSMSKFNCMFLQITLRALKVVILASIEQIQSTFCAHISCGLCM